MLPDIKRRLIKGGVVSVAFAIGLYAVYGLGFLASIKTIFLSDPAISDQHSTPVNIAAPVHGNVIVNLGDNSSANAPNHNLQSTNEVIESPHTSLKYIPPVLAPKKNAQTRDDPKAHRHNPLATAPIVAQGPRGNAAAKINGAKAYLERKIPIKSKSHPNDLVDGNALTYLTLAAYEIPTNVIVKLSQKDTWAIDSFVVEMPSGLKPHDFVRHIEIQTSLNTTGPWRTIGTTEIRQDTGPQSVEWDALPANYVRIIIQSNWGGRKTYVGDISIYGFKMTP